MNIVIENSSNQLSNLGDVAMLQVAIERLRQLWPSARLEVVTSNAKQLSKLFPAVHPLSLPLPHWGNPLRRWAWSWLPAPLQPAVAGVELHLRQARPGLNQELVTALNQCDILVHSGAGVFSDAFLPGAMRRLQLLQTAADMGKPTALFGQGLGPITSPLLAEAASAALPLAKLVSLREAGHSHRLCQELGLNMDRVHVTGDDALELGVACQEEPLRPYLGINLRFAPYSGISRLDRNLLIRMGASLRRAIESSNLEARSIVIDPGDAASFDTIRGLCSLPVGAAEHPASVSGLLTALGTCRAVVTGSYHAAVLALAQGVPAVGLVASDYYEYKFSGLQSMFKTGLSYVDVRQPSSDIELLPAIEGTLGLGEQARESLRASAESQVQRSRGAYHTFRNIVGA